MSGCATSYNSMTMINTIRQRHKITVNRSHLFCILSIRECLSSMRRTLASNTSSILCRSDTGASSSSVPTSQPTTSAIARMVCSVGLLSASLRSVLSTVVLDSCAASAICWVINRKAMQPIQLRAVDDDAYFAVIGNNVDGLHYNTSFPRCGCFD